MNPIDRVLVAIERHGCNPVREGDSWRASCPSPAHTHGNRKNPALTITEGNDGAVLLKCHAGCDTIAVLDAIGLAPRDLFPPKDYQAARKPEKPLPVHSSPPDGMDGLSRFTYTDANKRPVIYVTRQDMPDGKRIRQWGPGPNGKGWIPSLKYAPRPRPLYRLPAILNGEIVCIHEGEKSVVAACKAGLLGIHTTTLGGAGNAHHSDFTPLQCRSVVVIPDNDKPGRKHAEQVAKLAMEAGAASVRIISLPDVPEKGDIVEWLQAGGTPEAWKKLLDAAEPVPGRDADDVIRMADVNPEPLTWLWPGRFPLGKLTMLAGDPGLGKSMLTIELAAHVSTGRPWPWAVPHVSVDPC